MSAAVKSIRGRLPRDPRPIRCPGCMGLPRFVDRVAVKCVCNAPPHPLAYLALLPADQVLTPAELRAAAANRSKGRT